MKTTGIRLEVSQDFYLKLLDEQNKQKSLTGRKPALADIILKLCQQGIKYQNEKIAVQPTAIPPKQKDQITDPIRENLLATKEKELLSKEAELRLWEVEIRGRELDLIDRDKTVSEKAIAVLDQREELNDQKEDMLNISTDTIKQNILNENLKDLLNEKENLNIFLKRELKDMKDDIYRSLIRIESNTQTSTFMKYIVPFLPVVSTIIAAVILGKKIENKESLGAVETEILKQFNSLDNKAQDEVKKYMEAILSKPKE